MASQDVTIRGRGRGYRRPRAGDRVATICPVSRAVIPAVLERLDETKLGDEVAILRAEPTQARIGGRRWLADVRLVEVNPAWLYARGRGYGADGTVFPLDLRPIVLPRFVDGGSAGDIPTVPVGD